MYCSNCGIELNQNARFCSGCGKDTADARPAASTKRDWDLHVSVLGWLLIASALLWALGGIIVILGGQFAARIVGQNPSLVDNDVPVELISLIGPGSFLIGLLIIALGVPVAAAGAGLLQYKSWGRVLAVVMAAIMGLQFFPLGLVLTIYAFWVLLSEGGKDHYTRKSLDAAY